MKNVSERQKTTQQQQFPKQRNQYEEQGRAHGLRNRILTWGDSGPLPVTAVLATAELPIVFTLGAS